MTKSSAELALLIFICAIVAIIAVWTTKTKAYQKPMTTDDKISKLKELEQLRNSNTITEEEFTKMKENILS